MKTKFLFVCSVVLFMVALVGCKTSRVNCKEFSVPPFESISGVVCDESGNAIRNIKIEVFLDEQLDVRFMEIDCRADEEYCCAYTDDNGHYSMGHASSYSQTTMPEYVDVYVVATDTSGVYKTQMQHSRITYYLCGSGEGSANIVMTKL